MGAVGSGDRLFTDVGHAPVAAALCWPTVVFFLMIRRPPRSTLFPYNDALPISNADKLFRTGESRSSNETGLSLIGALRRPRSHDFGDAVINHFNNGRTAARIALEHDVRRFDVAMDNAAGFGGSQSTRNLLDNFQRERKRQWTFPPDFGLECFALDQLHHIEAFAILFTVMTDPRDVWMVNVRSGAGFTQEARPDSASLRDFPVNHFHRDL